MQLRHIGFNLPPQLLSVFALVIASWIVALDRPSAEDQLGVARIEADHSIVTMPFGTVGIVFDTTDWSPGRDTIPQWRFLGNLKADSLVLRGGERHKHISVPLTDSSQLEGIKIVSEAFARCLEKINPVRLQRRIPAFNPADTLFWDAIRQRWHKVPDLSRHYKVVFDDSLSVDSVVDWLSDVPGVVRPDGIMTLPPPD